MGALAAVADNNDAKKLKLGYDNLTLLIINTAIQLNECRCILRSPQRIITKEYCGLWSGKSGFDWQNICVLECAQLMVEE
jgi:hypothetical protein